MFDGNIPNLISYNEEMKKSLIDKIFFIDKVDADVFVDFGCADGTMIHFLSNIFPEKTYIGYDISEEQITLAQEKNPNIKFFSNWSELSSYLEYNFSNKKTAVVLNSIIHEVYSYGTNKDVEQFWNKIYSTFFDYVIIRDMAVSSTTSRPSDQLNVLKIKKKYDQKRMNEFEQQWGSISENWSMVHFLLKYRYVQNWDREVLENYLPISYEKLLKIIPNNYNPLYHEHFVLPYIRNTIKNDFDIDLQDKTHIKLILERK